VLVDALPAQEAASAATTTTVAVRFSGTAIRSSHDVRGHIDLHDLIEPSLLVATASSRSFFVDATSVHGVVHIRDTRPPQV
jgi:hypothetical protein